MFLSIFSLSAFVKLYSLIINCAVAYTRYIDSFIITDNGSFVSDEIIINYLISIYKFSHIFYNHICIINYSINENKDLTIIFGIQGHFLGIYSIEVGKINWL